MILKMNKFFFILVREFLIERNPALYIPPFYVFFKGNPIKPYNLPLWKYWKSRNESENGEMSRKKIKAFSRLF